jgi:pilus assembly protein CpaB
MRLVLIIIVLIFLGVVAAFSASLLVRFTRGQGLVSGNPASAQVDIVVAKGSLPAMSVVTSSNISKEKHAKEKLPEGYLSSPVEAIGRVLGIAVVEGQILTASCFVTEGSSAQLAAALPPGMRAVAVTLSSGAVTGGLLYPGCVIDILASFRLASREGGEAVSTTLLQGIQVLAVRDVTIVSKDRGDAEKKTPLGPVASPSSGSVTVTLMVDSKQAEALQLAVDFGKISVVMRNPLDRRAVDMDATVLRQGQLARLGTALEPQVAAALTQAPLPAVDPNDPNALKAVPGVNTGAKGSAPAKKPSWLVTIIRGQKVQEQQMDIAGTGGATEADTKK